MVEDRRVDLAGLTARLQHLGKPLPQAGRERLGVRHRCRVEVGGDKAFFRNGQHRDHGAYARNWPERIGGEDAASSQFRPRGSARHVAGLHVRPRDLFEQALEQYAEGMGKQSFLRLLEPGASLAHIRAIFDERVADMCCAEENKGCLFIHTAMELAPRDEELRGVLQRFMKRMSKAFAIGLESAKGRGEVASDVDTDAAGELLTSAMFGLAVLGRTGFPKATLDTIVDGTLDPLRAKPRS